MSFQRQNRNTVENFKELVLFAYNIYSDFNDQAKKRSHFILRSNSLNKPLQFLPQYTPNLLLINN